MTECRPIYDVEELAERAGVSRRTVRYYVQRGLLSPPTGVGRGKHYTERHLTELVSIRDRQAAGVALEQILAGESADAAPARASAVAETTAQQSGWTRIVIAPDVELHLRDRRLGADQLRRVASEILKSIRKEEV